MTHYDVTAVDNVLRRWEVVEGDLACVREWTAAEVLAAMGRHSLTPARGRVLLDDLALCEPGPAGARGFFRARGRSDLFALTRDCCDAGWVWLDLMVRSCALSAPDSLTAAGLDRLQLAFIETMLALVEAQP